MAQLPRPFQIDDLNIFAVAAGNRPGVTGIDAAWGRIEVALSAGKVRRERGRRFGGRGHVVDKRRFAGRLHVRRFDNVAVAFAEASREGLQVFRRQLHMVVSREVRDWPVQNLRQKGAHEADMVVVGAEQGTQNGTGCLKEGSQRPDRHAAAD